MNTTRRGALIAAAASPLAAAGPALASGLADKVAPAAGRPAGNAHDFDWLAGRWNVRHHRLKSRLTGSTEWEDFDGASVCWLTLDGLGTCDDNLIQLPDGDYRAMGVRAFDPKDGLWSIWWIDGRNPRPPLDPPVRGGFKDGVGVFECDDELRGQKIRVRYTWDQITPASARWQQAFSPDGGKSWEVNWVMWFTRAA